jgi:hypothetical protein
MLEHQALWLCPWSACGRPAGNGSGESAEPPRWAILDPDTRAFLGLARCRPRGTPAWLGWLERPSLDVFETEDEALVFSVARAWSFGTAWLVCDADGHPVGTMRGDRARNEDGSLLAVLELADDSASGRWLAPDGRALGTLSRAPDGNRATFAPGVAGYPFVKMILLATLLRDSEIG